MAHGKSLELQKIKPRLRMWSNPGMTISRKDWENYRKHAGWDKDQAKKFKRMDGKEESSSPKK